MASLPAGVEIKNRVIIMGEPTNHPSVREREYVNEIAVPFKMPPPMSNHPGFQPLSQDLTDQ